MYNSHCILQFLANQKCKNRRKLSPVLKLHQFSVDYSWIIHGFNDLAFIRTVVKMFDISSSASPITCKYNLQQSKGYIVLICAVCD